MITLEGCVPEPGTIEGWKESLDNFKDIIYPNVYEKYGFTLPEAFMAWQLNSLKNAIYDLEDVIKDDTDKSF